MTAQGNAAVALERLKESEENKKQIRTMTQFVHSVAESQLAFYLVPLVTENPGNGLAATGKKAAIRGIDVSHQPQKELIVNEILVIKESQHPNAYLVKVTSSGWSTWRGAR